MKSYLHAYLTVAMNGTSDQSCWLAKARKAPLLSFDMSDCCMCQLTFYVHFVLLLIRSLSAPYILSTLAPSARLAG